MLVKFIRKDCRQTDVLYLEEGKHVVGRGELLNCTDKRISREHCCIEVQKDGNVVFTALHENPCFYFASISPKSMQVLHKDEHRVLKNGDEISFLQDSFCYIICIENEASKTSCTTVNQPYEASNNETNENITSSLNNLDVKSTEVGNKEESTERIGSDNMETTRDADTTDDDVIAVPPEAAPLVDLCDEVVDFNDGEALNDELTDNPPSPSLLDAPAGESPVKRKCEEEDVELNGADEGAESTQQNSKRPRVESESPIEKKPNIENLQMQVYNVSCVLEACRMRPIHKYIRDMDVAAPRGDAESTQDEAGCSGTVKQEPKQESDVKKEDAGGNDDAPPPRDKCQYGATCYRRNPQHRADMSHPGDPDYNIPVPCPYGSNCYRQNAQHRSQYTHPGPPAPRPQPAAPGMKNDGKDKTKPRKAKQKPKKPRRDSWSESEEEYDEEEPWSAADTSDEYEPETEEVDDMSVSEYSGGSSDENDNGNGAPSVTLSNKRQSKVTQGNKRQAKRGNGGKKNVSRNSRVRRQ